MNMASLCLKHYQFGVSCRKLLLPVALLLAAFSPAGAQMSFSTSLTQNSTPLAMQPGSPAGSYALSGFDTVNPYNSKLNFALPLLRIGGRGSAGYTVMLTLPRQWQITHVRQLQGCGQGGCNPSQTIHSYYPTDSTWSASGGVGPGSMNGRRAGSGYRRVTNETGGTICEYNDTTLTRLTFTAPDGSEQEFVDQMHAGRPLTHSACYLSPTRGRIFVTKDGSAATFVSDGDINDSNSPSGGGPFPVSGNLLFRDGTRYRINNGQVASIRDRHGNQVTFSYTSSALTGVTDSLGRQVTFGNGITFSGYNNA